MNTIKPAGVKPPYADHLSVVSDRASQALAASGYRSLLLYSGTRKEVFRDDFYFPFRANAPFKVFVPLLDAADSFVFLEPGRKPLLVFHRDEDYWHKPAQLPTADWVGCFDVRTVGSSAAARAALPADLSGTAFVGEPFRELTSYGVAAVNPDHLLMRLEFPRAAKTAYEVAALRDASRLGALGHLAATTAFQSGASEFDIALAFLKGTGMREQELPYNPIIAINEGAAVLHYQVQAREPPTQRRSLLIDAGAESAGYASDITRTHAAAAGEFASLIEAMDRLQLRLCDMTRAGVDWRDIHLASYRDIGALLVDSGVLKCNATEAEASRVTSVFYPHGIGHLLGLQVHDAGGLLADDRGTTLPRPDGHPFLRLTRLLQPGFVVTMEPGFYFIDALLAEARGDARAKLIDWKRVEQLKPFGGIRIEDNLAVRPEGPPENLTRDAFRAVA